MHEAYVCGTHCVCGGKSFMKTVMKEETAERKTWSGRGLKKELRFYNTSTELLCGERRFGQQQNATKWWKLVDVFLKLKSTCSLVVIWCFDFLC